MNTMLSRVADHLYWTGRYVERAEHSARVLNVHIHLMLEEAAESREQHLSELLQILDQPDLEIEGPANAYWRLTLDPENPDSVRSCIRSARENSRQIRERISSEMWEQINRVRLYCEDGAREAQFENQPQQLFQEVHVGLHLFNGLTDSTMSRDQAWLFIQIGRWLERAGQLSTLLEAYLQESKDKSYIDWLGLLKSCTAFEAFRKRLGVDLSPQKIVEFLIINPGFPHSLSFSVIKLRGALRELEDETENRKSRELKRILGKMQYDLEFAESDEILAGDLPAFFKRFRDELQTVHSLIYRLYISREVEV